MHTRAHRQTHKQTEAHPDYSIHLCLVGVGIRSGRANDYWTLSSDLDRSSCMERSWEQFVRHKLSCNVFSVFPLPPPHPSDTLSRPARPFNAAVFWYSSPAWQPYTPQLMTVSYRHYCAYQSHWNPSLITAETTEAILTSKLTHADILRPSCPTR